MSPVFCQQASRGMKLWRRIYYRPASRKTKRTFRKPHADVLRQIGDMGLDARYLSGSPRVRQDAHGYPE